MRSYFVGCEGLFHLRLIDGDGDVLVLDVEAKAIEEAHIHVGQPDERELRQHITAPPRIEEREARDDEHQRGDVVAEAVFAGEKIEKFALCEAVTVLALALAPFARLAKDFLVRDRPGGTGDRQRQQHQVSELIRQRHPSSPQVPLLHEMQSCHLARV